MTDPNITLNHPPGRWAGRIAWACCALVPLSVLAVRLGLDFTIGLPTFALGCLLALLVCVAIGVMALLPRHAGHRGALLLRALPAAPWAALLLALTPSINAYPPIHDISTDTYNPPRFEAAINLRGPDANPVAVNPEALTIQRQHYAHIRTLTSPLPPAEAFKRAVATAASLGWQVHHTAPDRGLIEAHHTSTWFGFVDDIVIRVRASEQGFNDQGASEQGFNDQGASDSGNPSGQGSSVDLRSVSRVGRSDLGANARRIRAFGDAFASKPSP